MLAETETAAPEASAKPIKTFGKHKCLYCGTVFEATHNRQTRFCLPSHKTKFQDAQRIRGRQMVKLAQAWRLGRNTRDPKKRAMAAYAFQELCALTDLYNAEDSTAGTPDAFVAVRPMFADNYRPSVDGKRR